jgi:CheY-like chemotaxis protein/HPt (histidine-containing phosphotransfer) domain-containing protein
MITCVLDLSEIEAEHVELQAVEFDVQSVGHACLDLIRPTAEAKRLSLSFVIAPGTPRELIADPTRLRQVLLNLLGNAAKFTDRGAIKLHLRRAANGSMLRIEVSDTGAGIPVDQRQRLFNDFERLDNEATRAAEGSGLGLALSARLAILMGGRLGHDDNPGGGSVFWLELPLNTAATSHADLGTACNGRDADSLPMLPLHVLLVDDVLMNRDIGEAFLRAAGHEVTCAERGAEAVAAAASTDFDVVLMDVRMPEMDGLEATRRIRALEGARGKVPIVALTAHAFSEQVKDCRKAGMNSHLAKPFQMEALLAAVSRAVADKQRPDAGSGPDCTTEIQPADPAPVGSEKAILNRGAFERTSAFLTPQAVAGFMGTIAERGRMLVHDLREPDAISRNGDELAHKAHALAGSAGMFGFERLVAKGRSFEQAVKSGAPEASSLADELSAEAEAALQEIYNLDIMVR